MFDTHSPVMTSKSGCQAAIKAPGYLISLRAPNENVRAADWN